MSMRVTYRLSPLFCIAGLLYGDITAGGPLAGYAAIGNRELRAIRGVPGAFRYGDPFPLPAGVTGVYPAPCQNFALVSQGSRIAVLPLSFQGPGTLAVIEGAMRDADWVAFSPSGTAAVLHSAATNALQVVRGLPEAPAAGATIDTSTLPASLRSAAVSDDGAALLLTSAVAVYFAAANGTPQLVAATAGEPVAVFLRSSRDALIADSGAGTVSVLPSGAAPALRLVTSGLDGLAAIYPGSDGASVFVRRPAAQDLASVDIATGEIRHHALPVVPEELLPLRNRDTFLVSAGPGQAGWVFYQEGSQRGTVGIPAVNVPRPNGRDRGVR